MAAVIAAIVMITTPLVSTVHITYTQNITPKPVTNYTSITVPSIAELNSTTIINAINAKIKLIRDEIAFRNVFNNAHLMLSKIDIRNIMCLSMGRRT